MNAGKQNEANSTSTSQNTTQEWLPVKDIHQGVIHRRDGSYVAAIRVEPVNIHLLTDPERERYINLLEEVLNGVDESFQIISIARPVDLDSYIRNLNDLRNNAPNRIKHRLLSNYISDAARTATGGEALERHFYILLVEESGKNKQASLNELINRAKELASSLSGSGLSSHITNDQELRELLFIFTNPNQASYERAPISSYQFPAIFNEG